MKKKRTVRLKKMVILPTSTCRNLGVSDRDGKYWNVIAMLSRCNSYAFTMQ